MRVTLLNDGDYGDAENVGFPVEVEALRLTQSGFFKIHSGELHRVGFVGFDHQTEWYFKEGSEAVLAGQKPEPVEQLDTSTATNFMMSTGDKDMLNVEASERRYCVRDKCCNQFGERDEIQAIIDALQADVKARDERIKVLNSKCDELYKLAEELGACSEFLKINFACSWGE